MTKKVKSKIDSTKHGIYLINAVKKDELFAYATGTTWEKGDKRCNGGDKAPFFIAIPGTNQFVDCTDSKMGKGHFMAQSQSSHAKARAVFTGSYIGFYANADYASGEEMNFINNI